MFEDMFTSRSVPSFLTGLEIRGEADSPRNGYPSLSVANDNTQLLGYPPATHHLSQPGIIGEANLMNFERLKSRRSSFPARKKSEARLPGLKPGGPKKSVTKSPSLPKRQLSPEGKGRSGATAGNTLQLPEDALTQHISRSLEDLEKDKDDDSGTRENGSGCSDTTDDVDGNAGTESVASDAARTRVAMEHIQEKITRTMEQIKEEQATKEANVNEYLRLAGEADKQQLQRIKQVFEKKNQKSTAMLSQQQKKLEKYTKALEDVQTHGAHRQAKDKLKDMGQGLKDVGANIVDGITEFSGGVVGNIKGAKESIVSKPREFAHLIKNKFGSADNINSIKASEDSQQEEGDKSGGGGGTLPARLRPSYAREFVGGGGGGGKSSDDTQAHRYTEEANFNSETSQFIAIESFKYGSDEDNSSITSGSGFGAQSSPHSNSQNASQQLVVPQAALDSLVSGLQESREQNRRLQENLQRVLDDFENYKMSSQQEVTMLKNMLEEDKFKMERMEEQMNDITELNQHEVNNLKQDIGSMEEKIEYRLDERTADIQDLLESCQTRVQKMELQQQQQQIISMEMVENVTFRTILTKLINVVLALLAVILVFVSTTANLVAPFLTTRARILSTVVLVTCIVISWNNRNYICDSIFQLYDYLQLLLPNR